MGTLNVQQLSDWGVTFDEALRRWAATASRQALDAATI